MGDVIIQLSNLILHFCDLISYFGDIIWQTLKVRQTQKEIIMQNFAQFIKLQKDVGIHTFPPGAKRVKEAKRKRMTHFCE